MTQPTTMPVAIITGAARGIGLASANWFLAREHSVVLIDNDASTLAATAKAMSASDHVMSILCDVSDPEQAQAAVTQVETRFGRADTYVNGQVLAVDGGFDAVGVGLPTLRRDAAKNGS